MLRDSYEDYLARYYQSAEEYIEYKHELYIADKAEHDAIRDPRIEQQTQRAEYCAMEENPIHHMYETTIVGTTITAYMTKT